MFETFTITKQTERGEICIGARSLYIVDHGKATLQAPEQKDETLLPQRVAWIPAGVAHQLIIQSGQCMVLRLRKSAFSQDQEVDVSARKLLLELDTWTRSHSFLLPQKETKDNECHVPIAQIIHDIIANPADPFAAKAGTLNILRHFLNVLPDLEPQQDLPPAPARIRIFIDWLREHHAEPITMQDALKQTRLSKSHFHRCFHDATGTSLSRYLNRQRISVAKNLLKYSERGILDIALSCGFNSTSRFYEVFSSLVGCSPKEYQRKQTHKNQ
jgi:AraC-like DNA-binding protein